MANTIWGGNTNNKWYLQSGTFTSTIKTSQSYASFSTQMPQVSWDDTDTFGDDRDFSILYKVSGKFTSTVRDSVDVSAIDNSMSGISTIGSNSAFLGNQADKFYTLSGKFTSTLKTSESCASQSTSPLGFDLKENDTLWGKNPGPAKLYLQSGQYTTILKTSLDVSSGFNFDRDVSYDGTNTLSMGGNSKSLKYRSGLFTSTVKDSETVSGIDPNPDAITIDSAFLRLGTNTNGGVAITLPQFFMIRNVINLPIFTVMALELGANLNADGAITLPVLTLSGAAHLDADIGITLPAIALAIRAYNGSAPECIAMNTKNFAVSEYSNYGFNSMARFNGVNLICDQNGIYEQDSSGTDNAGVDDYKIKAHIKSGTIDIHSQTIQRMRNYWLNYQTDGDAEIVVGADKKATRYYFLPYHSGLSGINERRAKPERGIRERHFNFKIRNVNGSDLEIDKLTVTLEPIVSKRR